MRPSRRSRESQNRPGLRSEYLTVVVRSLTVLTLIAVGIVAWRVTAGGSSSATPLFAPAVLGGQPRGAVVQAQEDRDLAVALAAAPRDGKTLAIVTVLGPDGEGATGLGVRISGVSATPGPAGTYAALLPVARPARVVRVLVTRRDGHTDTVPFRLPAAWPPRPAGRLMARIDRVYRDLRALVIHERLASSPTAEITSVYREAAPTSLAISSSNGNREVVIGEHRWDRHPGAGWETSQQLPALRAITPFWRGTLQDVTVLGTTTASGRPALRLSFAAPQIPAFFELEVDRVTYRPLRLTMIAAAHFMQHRYSGFDVPQHIVAPSQTAGRPSS